MMKKIGLCMLLCVAAVTAGAWGLDRTFVSQPFFNGHSIKNPTNYTSSALYAVVRGGKSNFTACIDEHASEVPLNDNNQANYFSSIEKTLNSWIIQVRKQIEASGRAPEFADVSTWLPSRITLTPTSCNKADIQVRIVYPRQVGRREWANVQTPYAWKLSFPFGEDSAAQALQESGIFWGLGVLTKTFKPQTVEEGLSKNTSDQQYSIYAATDSHPAPGTSVMWWKQPSTPSITCDDVEGFINAVDFIQFMEEENSARLENGWKSLCGHPYYYLRGRATANKEDLDSLRQETAQYRQKDQTILSLQQLLNQWKDYHENQVIPALSQYRDLLKRQPRPLDNKGLMLSAQVNHLEQVNHCTYSAIKLIGSYAINLSRCAGTDCPVLRAELAQLNCSVELDPIQTPGLEKSTPLQQDYPTGKMHTCAVCGKPIEIGKAFYDETDARSKRKTKHYRYYRHFTCPKASLDQARAYHDDATLVQAPTYVQLQVRDYLAENLPLSKKKSAGAASKSQVSSIEIKPVHSATVETAAPKPQVTPTEVKPANSAVSQTVSLNTPHAKAPVKDLPTEATSSTPTQPAAHQHLREVGTVLPGETIHCSVCGAEIHEGDTYYKRTQSQFIHRHGQCAYSFFAKKHNVDENALAAYTRTYFFEIPNEVASARAEMEALGLSVDSVRQLREQKEEMLRQQTAAWEQEQAQQQARQQARERFNAKCRVYRKVTAQDVERFKTQYSEQLKRIDNKVKKNHKLTSRQKKLHQYYEQLLENEKITRECLALEQASM